MDRFPLTDRLIPIGPATRKIFEHYFPKKEIESKRVNIAKNSFKNTYNFSHIPFILLWKAAVRGVLTIYYDSAVMGVSQDLKYTTRSYRISFEWLFCKLFKLAALRKNKTKKQLCQRLFLTAKQNLSLQMFFRVPQWELSCLFLVSLFSFSDL